MMKEDTLPRHELRYTRPNLDNRANRLMAWIEGSAWAHVPLHDIAGTQPARTHAHQKLTGTELRHRQLDDAHIVIAMIFNSTHIPITAWQVQRRGNQRVLHQEQRTDAPRSRRCRRHPPWQAHSARPPGGDEHGHAARRRHDRAHADLTRYDRPVAPRSNAYENGEPA